jgi:hypothetical protein
MISYSKIEGVKMKKLLLVIALMCNLYAIGGIDSLPSDEKKVATAIKDMLKIDSKNAFSIYKDYIQAYLNESEWQMHWFDNESPAKGKVNDSDIRTMFISLINNNRIINITIVKFPKVNQALVYTIETLPRKSSLVIDKFTNLEQDKKFIKKRETSNFAYFKEDGYMSRVNIFVSPPVGAIQYVDLSVYDLK